jgi:hypothetical protein
LSFDDLKIPAWGTRRPGAGRTAALLASLIVALCWAAPSLSQGPRLAVMDFHAGEGVTAEQARTLTGMLRSALYSTSKYTLINRE